MARRRTAQDEVPTGHEDDPEPATEDVARAILVRKLEAAARTRHELAEALARKNVPDDVAGRLLDRFTELGLIDDAAFAHAWVESRRRTKGLVPRALAAELRRKGVADELIRSAVDQVDVDDERESARALVQRKLRSMSGLDHATAQRRLAGMLARKGYGPGVAFEVVREELGGDVHEPHSI